jgi:hypothetical protein
MSYKLRIITLTESLKVIDNNIKNSTDGEQLAHWHTQQQNIKNEIRRLERLQWEWETQTVHYDDDRR